MTAGPADSSFQFSVPAFVIKNSVKNPDDLSDAELGRLVRPMLRLPSDGNDQLSAEGFTHSNFLKARVNRSLSHSFTGNMLEGIIKHKERYEDVLALTFLVAPEIQLNRLLTPDIVLAENMKVLIPRQFVHQPGVLAVIDVFKRQLANSLLPHLSCFATRAKFSAHINPGPAPIRPDPSPNGPSIPTDTATPPGTDPGAKSKGKAPEARGNAHHQGPTVEDIPEDEDDDYYIKQFGDIDEEVWAAFDTGSQGPSAGVRPSGSCYTSPKPQQFQRSQSGQPSTPQRRTFALGSRSTPHSSQRQSTPLAFEGGSPAYIKVEEDGNIKLVHIGSIVLNPDFDAA